MKKFKPKKFKSQSASLYDKLTKVRFKVGGKIFDLDLGSEFLLEKNDLHSQVERLPAVMGYFGSVISLLEQEVKDLEIKKKVIEAKIDEKVREAGCIGEARVDKRIKRHPKWLEINLKLNSAKGRFAGAKNLQQNLRVKFDSLLSRSQDIRKTPSDKIMGVKKEDVIRIKD